MFYSFHGLRWTHQIGQVPMCLHSSVGKALQRTRRDHGFESRRGADIVFFFVFVFLFFILLFCLFAFFRINLQLFKLHLPLRRSYLHLNLFFRCSHDLHSRYSLSWVVFLLFLQCFLGSNLAIPSSQNVWYFPPYCVPRASRSPSFFLAFIP